MSPHGGSGLDAWMSVKVKEDATGLQARFEAAQGAPMADLEPRLRELMKPFALAYAVAVADGRSH